jgi:hypothetical protein
MAKFLCVCGHRLSTSGDIPNPDEWECLSAVDFTALWDLGAEDPYMRSTIMYRCPVSDHLWFFWKGIEEPPVLYAPTPLPEGWH